MKKLNLFRKTVERSVNDFTLFAIPCARMNFVRGGSEPVGGGDPGDYDLWDNGPK